MNRIRHMIPAVIAALTTSVVMTAGATRAADAPQPNPDLEAARHRFGSKPETSPSPTAGSPVQPRPDSSLQPALEAAVQGPDPLDPPTATAFTLETQRKVDEEARKGLVGFDPNALSKRLQGSAAAVDSWLGHLPAGPRQSQPVR